MEDRDLYPCPWCRGELVHAAWLGRPRSYRDKYAVVCDTCGMQGPILMTLDNSDVALPIVREMYNVVAKLVEGIDVYLIDRVTHVPR